MKRKIKLALLWLARAMGLFRLSRWLTRRGLMIVGWHGLSLDDEHVRFQSLFITPAEFTRRLEFLTRTYRVISLDEAMRQHARGYFDPGQVVLTFDDGFYNFKCLAAPILRRFGVPATNYIVTQAMCDQRPAPPLVIRDMILLTRKTRVEFALNGRVESHSLATAGDRASFARSVLDRLHAIPPDGAAQHEYARSVAAVLDVDFDDLAQRRVWHSMTREEVRQMSDDGFDMQPHTHRHLNVVDYPELAEQEVTVCRRVLEEVTGKPAVDFCYPSGRWEQRVWDVLRRAGFRSAVTTKHGPNDAQTPALALRRVLNGQDRCQLEFEFEVSNLKWLLCRLLGRVSRHSPSETKGRWSETRISF